MRKFFCGTALLMTCLFSSTSIASNDSRAIVSNYDSTPYIQQQYDIIRGIFHNFEVSLDNVRDIKIIIPNHYGFQTGKADLTRKVKDDLRSLAKVLNKYNESSVKVIGHTDSVGTAESNIKLSQRRAIAVRSVLADAKVAPQRITMIGEGEELPRCTNDTAKGKECNRRVEIIVTIEPYLY